MARTLRWRDRDESQDRESAQYFRDVERASAPLGAREEARVAAEIQRLQTAAWALLLSRSALLAAALQARPRDAALRALHGAPGHDLARRAAAAAARLARADRDRVLFDALVAEAQRVVGDARFLRRLRAARAAAEAARHELARRNLRLVVKMARRYRGLGIGAEDLIQEGNLGLLRAVDRYDVERGFRFSTYAAWWIRQTILRALRDDSQLVRLPAHVSTARARLRRVTRQLTGELGRVPTVDELLGATGLPAYRVEAALRRQEHTSLDGPRDVDDERPLHETLEDPRGGENVATLRLVEDETRREVAAAIGRLAPLEAEVLRGRYGFDDEEEDGRTFAAIGREHGLSRERIRQIEKRALGKMRRWLAPPAARHQIDRTTE